MADYRLALVYRLYMIVYLKFVGSFFAGRDICRQELWGPELLQSGHFEFQWDTAGDCLSFYNKNLCAQCCLR